MLGRAGLVTGTREFSVIGLPYLIVYAIASETKVDVLTVLHTRRRYSHACGETLTFKRQITPQLIDGDHAVTITALFEAALDLRALPRIVARLGAVHALGYPILFGSRRHACNIGASRLQATAISRA